jgi:tetratricopeptide (TPR) repeat protein
MNVSVIRSHCCGALFALILLPLLTIASATVCSAQNNSGTRGKYVISVQDLTMTTKGRAAFDKGSRLLERGEAANSIALLQQAIAEYSEHYMAYYDLGIANSRLDHLAEAEQAFQKAIDITKGNFAPAQFGLAATLCKKTQFLQAVTILQRAMELEPASPIGKYYLAQAQLGLNHLAQAEQNAEEALVRRANFAEAYLLLAQIHRVQRNLPAVTADLESYVKCEPRKELAKSMVRQIQRDMAQDAAMTASTRP